MSFQINWPEFDSEFIEKASRQLTTALNQGKKPDNIHGEIKVTQLNMGSKAPELEILEVSELLQDRFKGMFKLVYSGDASVVVQTHVQANPLCTRKIQSPLGVRQGMLLAQKPLIVPMEMKLSNVALRGIIVLVVDKEKGITLVFKSDPLESVLVSSTFDNIPSIKKLLQRQIEAQLRSMFQEELPQIIHNLSLMFIREKEEEISMENNPFEIEDMPHHKKWANNDPVFASINDLEPQEGYVLYKSLSSSDQLFGGEMGLQKIVEGNRSRSNSQPSLPVMSTSEMTALDFKNSRINAYLNSIDDDSSTILSASNVSLNRLQTQDQTWKRPIIRNIATSPARRPSQAAIRVIETKTLQPSDNTVTAHLANLMTSHLTISPNTQGVDHLVFRGAPSEIFETRSTASGAGRRRKLKRTVHVVKVEEKFLRPESDLRASRSVY